MKGFEWLQLLCSFLFPPTAEKWSFAPPAPRCAAFGRLSSSRGQQQSSQTQLGDPEPPEAKAEVTGEFSVWKGDKGLFMPAWPWTIRGSWRLLWRHLLSAVVWLSCSSPCFGLWTCEPWVIFPPVVGLILKWAVRASARAHFESSLGLIEVKVAIFSLFHDRWPCQRKVRRQCLLT